MWKSWMKRLFNSEGKKHPLDRKPMPLNKHPLGIEVANVIFYSQNEAKRLQHQTISSEHILLALTQYPNGLARQTLTGLGIETKKIEALIPAEVTKAALPSGAFLISKETETIFQKAMDEARYFKRTQIGSEHILLALTHFENMTAYRIFQQMDVIPWTLRDKVHELVVQRNSTVQANPQLIEKFTKRARYIIILAQEIAQQHSDRIIGVEYLLIALAEEKGGVAGRALRELEAMPEKLAPILYPKIKSTPPHDESFTLSEEVINTFALAIDESELLSDDYVGTEHLLLGLLRQPDLSPVQALAQLGIIAEMLRDKIKTILTEQFVPKQNSNMRRLD
jgi:ATP-dependent Clp protease ATP-binding subunit ClpA